jgi:hypothetical protein
VRAGAGICGTAHQRKRADEGRWAQWIGERDPREAALGLGGAGDCGGADAAGRGRAAAAQLSENEPSEPGL